MKEPFGELIGGPGGVDLWLYLDAPYESGAIDLDE
jgi:hypothetical protein